MSDTTPEPDPTPAEPLAALTVDEVVKFARGVVTGEYLLADVRDHDWQFSLMLLLGAWDETTIPPNLSTMFLVPMAPHAGGRWLNGRVPGVTTKAEAVPVESVEALLDQIQTFWRALNPDVAPVPQSGP